MARVYDDAMPSSAIRSFDYDAGRCELTITFAGGRTYVYWLVPAAVAAALAQSPSKGAFHNAHIRDRYPYRRAKAAPARPSLRETLEASVEATPASGRSAGRSGESRGRG